MKAVKYIHKRNNKLIEYSFLKFMAIQALNNMSLIAINIVSVAKEYLSRKSVCSHTVWEPYISSNK